MQFKLVMFRCADLDNFSELVYIITLIPHTCIMEILYEKGDAKNI